MAKHKILLAGESWVSTTTHIKGFDQFATATYALGAEPLVEALAGSDFALTYMPSHAAARDFPLTLEGLRAWDAIILSTSARTRCCSTPTPSSTASRPPTG